MNNIEKLCSLKNYVTSVEQFSDLQHLDKCLAIRASWSVRDTIAKLAQKDIKKKTKINDLYA